MVFIVIAVGAAPPLQAGPTYSTSLVLALRRPNGETSRPVVLTPEFLWGEAIAKAYERHQWLVRS